MKTKLLLIGLTLMLVTAPASAKWRLLNENQKGERVIAAWNDDKTRQLHITCRRIYLIPPVAEDAGEKIAIISFDNETPRGYAFEPSGFKNWLKLRSRDMRDELVRHMKVGLQLSMQEGGSSNRHNFSLNGFTRKYNHLGCIEKE